MSATTSKKMTYGECFLAISEGIYLTDTCAVRLGNSGLKVSRIILGTMQYGDKDWQQWVIDDEEEAFKHIKFACVFALVTPPIFRVLTFTYRYDAGITTFDTADVSGLSGTSQPHI